MGSRAVIGVAHHIYRVFEQGVERIRYSGRPLVFGRLVNCALCWIRLFSRSVLHHNDDCLTHYLHNQAPKKPYWITTIANHVIRNKE